MQPTAKPRTFHLAPVHEHGGLLHSQLADAIRSMAEQGGITETGHPKPSALSYGINGHLLELPEPAAPGAPAITGPLWMALRVTEAEAELAAELQGFTGRWPERWATVILMARKAREGWCGAPRCMGPNVENVFCRLDGCQGNPGILPTDAAEPEPVVGMGATYCGYTDRHAYTIVEVSRHGRTITLQRDRATLLNGSGSAEPDALDFAPGGFLGHTSGTQRYRYDFDPDGAKIKATRRKDGKFRASDEDGGGARILIGSRTEHYDFNH